MVAAQNFVLVRTPVTFSMSPGWSDTIMSIEFMDPGLVSEGFLIDLLECLPLVIYGLLWDFPDIQATQGPIFVTPLIFLDIIPLFDSLIWDFK